MLFTTRWSVSHILNNISYELFSLPEALCVIQTIFWGPLDNFFRWLFFFCYSLSFMKSCIVFEGLSIILYLFWYLQMWVLNQAAADLVLNMYFTVSIPKWHIIWIFVYLRRHMFWGPLVYLFRVVSFVYVTFLFDYTSIYYFVLKFSWTRS